MGKPESCLKRGEVVLLANFCKGKKSYVPSEQEYTFLIKYVYSSHVRNDSCFALDQSAL